LRKLLITASVLAIAAPGVAGAQTGQEPAPNRADDEIARSLPSPAETEAIGRVMGDVVGAVMDVPIGPVVEAIDPGRRLSRRERERTIGDVASRDDPYYQERLQRSIGAITSGMGDMAVQVAILAPVLRRSMEDLERNMERATRGLPRRDRDDDHDTDRDD